MIIYDRLAFSESTRSKTPEGFLKCRGRVMRTGIQDYYGMEIGMESTNAYKKFHIYRPKEVVFDSAVLDSMIGLDITNDHPKSNINSETYKDLTVGVVTSKGSVDEKSGYVVCDLLVKDAKAIQMIESGKVELSAGYNSSIDFADGVTEDGVPYNGRITSLALNHLAIVSKGRAGDARIFDGVEMKTLKINDQEFPVPEEVEKAFTDALTKVETLEAEKDELSKKVVDAESALAESEKMVENLNDSLKDAESRILSDEQIKEKVLSVAQCLEDCEKIVPSFSCESMDIVEIKRTCLGKAFADRDLSDKTDEYISGLFDATLEHCKTANAKKTELGKTIIDSCEDKKKAKKQESSSMVTYGDVMKATADAWKTK